MIINKKFFLSYSFFLAFGLTHLCAQSGTVVSGGDATGVGGKQSYSVGQVDYVAVSGNGGTVHQGVQQPYQVSIITGKEDKNIQVTASIYPNPAISKVTLTVNGDDTQNTSYTLYDAQEKLIANRTVNSKQTNIPMETLSVGTYFIKVLNNKKEIKVFKVIKNS